MFHGLSAPRPLRSLHQAIATLLLCAVCACGPALDGEPAGPAAPIETASVFARGVDYSWARPGGAAIQERGYRFAARYLSHDTTGKTIRAAEVADLHSHGIGIALVWEDNADAALGGTARGVADGREALAQASALGFPGDLPLYFAVDFDATPAQQGPIDAYLRGAASVLGAGRVGVYGGYYIVKRCFENGSAAYGWQTVAWSGGQVLPAAHLYQTGAQDFGNGADVNEARQSQYGAWFPGPPPPPPPPPPPGCGRLVPGQGLGVNQGRGSCDGRFTLITQNDGNLVLYQNGRGPIWASNTAWAGQGSYTAVMQDDGNFVLYRNGAGALWSTRTEGHPGSYLDVQNDGNLVLYAPGGTPLWWSHTCCR